MEHAHIKLPYFTLHIQHGAYHYNVVIEEEDQPVEVAAAIYAVTEAAHKLLQLILPIEEMSNGTR